MIRWHWYLKYLKLFSIGFWISFFMGLGVNSVSALWISTEVWLESFNSPVNSNYSITPLKWGAFLTNYLWVWKSVLALDSNILFWRTDNWYPYAYLEGDRYVEGFFDSYYSCDLMTWAGSPSNCSKTNITYTWTWVTADFDKQVFISFFKTVTAWQKLYVANDHDYYNWATYQYSYNFITVCWNSEELWHSFCFKWGWCTSNWPSLCNNYWRLVNSQNLRSQFNNNFHFWLLNSNWLSYAPWQNGYNWAFEGSQWGSFDTSFDWVATWDTSNLTCTWGDVLTVLETEGYNKYVCYWWLDNFDLYDSSLTYNPIAWRWLSIDDIRAWSWSRAWDTFQDWFFFWNWIYKDTSDNNYNAMWESYPAVYKTYFQLYNSYKWWALDPRTILEYCQLRTLSWSLLNNSAWGYFRPVCETVINEKQTWLWSSRLDWTIYSWWVYTWDTPVATNWNWVWTLSWINEQKWAINFIQDFFNKAKAVIPTNYPWTWGWMLPSYIIMFMLALILFRFLSH